MAEDETLHKREFTLTVEFTDEEREEFFERMMWEPEEDGGISDAIMSETIANLSEVGLRPTLKRIH